MTAALFDDMTRTARISPDGLYRYELGRRWAPHGDAITWVMLNPSTADALVDDQTIRRCVHYSQAAGFDALAVVNLYAYRTPQPVDLIAAHRAGVDVRGPDNWRAIGEALTESTAVALAWGATLRQVVNAGAPRLNVEQIARDLGRPLLCLGYTADGAPRHPSRLGNDAALIPYNPPRFAK